MASGEPLLRRSSVADAILRGRATYAEWGGGLTLEQFLERERRFKEGDWAGDTISTWFLEGSNGQCLSSCETFQVESFWRGVPGLSCGIASVYTEPALRGRSHARELLRRVEGEFLGTAPGLHAFFLFSDIGSAYYESAGYGALEACDRVYEPEEGDPFEKVHPCGVDEALEGARFPDAAYLLPPTKGFLDWQLERERAYADFFRQPRPSAQGARAGDARILWSVNYRKAELFALLLSAGTEAEATMLVAAARRMAYTMGLERFRAWEETASFPWPPGSTRAARDGSAPMLKPVVSGLAPRDWSQVFRATWI